MLKPEWLVLFGALTEVALFMVGPVMWRDLRRAGARRAGFALDAAAVLVAAAAPLVYWLVGGPWIVPALFAPVTILCWSPRLTVWVSGGPDPLHGLAKACWDVSARWQRMVAADEMTDRDRAWLRSSSEKLERWRTPDTSELVAIYQAKIADVLLPFEGSLEELEAREAARNIRINELREQLSARWEQR